MRNCMVQLTCYHAPPPGQVQLFGPGGGKLFEEVLSRR